MLDIELGVDQEKEYLFISSFGQLLSRLLRSSVTTEQLGNYILRTDSSFVI